LGIDGLSLLRDEIVESAMKINDERLHQRLFHLYIDFGLAHELNNLHSAYMDKFVE